MKGDTPSNYMERTMNKTEQMKSIVEATQAHTDSIGRSLERIQQDGTELGRRMLTRVALPVARLYKAMAEVVDVTYVVVAEVVHVAAQGCTPEEGLSPEEALDGLVHVATAMSVTDEKPDE